MENSGPFETYEDIYQSRGAQYHLAMQKYPRARDQEFQKFMATASLSSPALRILDIPSGGGYLQPYLPEDCHLTSVDPASNFLHADKNKTQLDAICAAHDLLPFCENSFDVILSLAGIHHVKNQASMFREWHRVLKRGGLLTVADGFLNSPTSRFLDIVVNQFNSMGHHGIYLSENSTELLTSCGFTVEYAEEKFYTWDFHTVDEMLDFCRTLFGMDRNPSNPELLEGIRQTVGYDEDSRGTHLNWSLFHIRARA